MPLEATRFVQLNHGWNAEPNAPEPAVRIEGNDLVLEFTVNAFRFHDVEEGAQASLRFRGVSRYRLGSTNDEGWYRGQCRFSRLAPRWGEFYEVLGDLRLNELHERWTTLGEARGPSRHFLFYLRDETFECDAEDWVYNPPSPPAGRTSNS